VIELARSGTKIAQLAATFGMSDATIYSWLKQERIDRGEIAGLSTEGALDLAAAKRRIKQLETEPAVSRKVNEVLLEGDLPPKRLSIGTSRPGSLDARQLGQRMAGLASSAATKVALWCPNRSMS